MGFMAAWSYNEARERVARTGGDAARVFRSVASQPSWVLKLAAVLAAFAVIGMLIVLIVPAIVIFLVVILVGSLVEKAAAAFRSLVGARDREGRKNVRVIVRRNEGSMRHG